MREPQRQAPMELSDSSSEGPRCRFSSAETAIAGNGLQRPINRLESREALCEVQMDLHDFGNSRCSVPADTLNNHAAWLRRPNGFSPGITPPCCPCNRYAISSRFRERYRSWELVFRAPASTVGSC